MAADRIIETVFSGGAYRVEKRRGKDRRRLMINWQGYERRAGVCRRGVNFQRPRIDELV